MVTKNWIRQYELVFSGPEGRREYSSYNQEFPLNIKFNITSDATASAQSLMDLSVFGLKESSVAALTGNGIKVFLRVGYSNLDGSKPVLKTIYTGMIVSTLVVTAPGKHETKFKCKASRIDSKPMAYKFPKGTTEGQRLILMATQARALLPDLNVDAAIVDMAQLTADEPSKDQAANKDLPEKTLLTDEVTGTFSTSRSIMTELTEYASTFDIKPLVVNDELHMLRAGGGTSPTNKVYAVLGKNLLSPPRRSMNNTEGAVGSTDAKFYWNMNMFLSPEVSINSTLVSDVRRNSLGTVDYNPIEIKVLQVRHSGEYRSSNWYTAITGTWDQDVLKKAPVQSVAEETKNPIKEPTFSGKGATGSF